MTYQPLATQIGAIYRLVAGDGLATAVFNDPFDPNYVGALREVSGLDSAEVRESASDMVEADGGTHGAFYFGRRPISLGGSVFNHASIAERDARLDRARRASLAMRSDSTLSWKPEVRQENLMTHGTFEGSSLSPWTAGTSTATIIVSPTFALSSTYAHTGTQSVRVAASHDATSNVGSIGNFSGLLATTFRMPVVPGKQYTGSYYYNITDPAANASGARVRIYWYKADGTAASTAFTTGSYQPTSAAALVRPFVTATAPSDAATCTLLIEPLNSWTTASDTFEAYIDSVMITQSSAPLTYFDGSTEGFMWQGDANASASGDFVERFTTVRRAAPFRESGGWVKDFQIQLVSEYSYIFSTGLKTVAAGVAAENRGNAPSYPVLAITGPSSNPTVSDGTRTFTSTGLAAGADIAAGETLEVDTLNHTAKFTAGARNGQSGNRFINWATTQWPYLTGQGTTQTFTLTGGGTLAVRYRDAWA